MCTKYSDQSLWHMISTMKMCAIIIITQLTHLSHKNVNSMKLGDIFLFGAVFPNIWTQIYHTEQFQ